MGHATTGTPTFVGYHGTSSVHVPAIQAGIQPPTGRNYGGGAQLGAAFYTTPDYTTAEYFADNAVVKAGGVPVILAVYDRNFPQLHGAAVPPAEWWSVASEYITDYDYLTAPINGLEPVAQIKFNPRAYHALEVR